jgi:hypothetical protein
MLWISSWMMTVLPDARAAEQADLSAEQIRLEQVDHLDARFEHLQLGGLLFQRRRLCDESTIAPWKPPGRSG